MPSKYSREAIQAIQQSTPDEKVVTFIRDSAAPVATILETTDVLSKAEVSSPNISIDDWCSIIHILEHAASRIETLTEGITLVRSGQYDPSKTVSAILQDLSKEQRELVLHDKESAQRLQMSVDRFRQYDPERVLLSLPGELRMKVAMVKGVAELLRTIDQKTSKGLPETWELLLDTLGGAADSLLETMEVTMRPTGKDLPPY